MNFQCPQEREVASAVLSGRWPTAFESELRIHIEECDQCTRVVLIAEALRRDRADAIQTARLVSPGLLWWRAQLLRRQRAMQEIAKPISFVAWLALSVASITVIPLIARQRSQLAGWVSTLVDLLSSKGFWQVAWTSTAGDFPAVLLLLTAGTLGLLGCLALYLATRRE